MLTVKRYTTLRRPDDGRQEPQNQETPRSVRCPSSVFLFRVRRCLRIQTGARVWGIMDLP
jgi:hypothetical protein